MNFFNQIPALDFIALCFFVTSWTAYAHYADQQSASARTLLAATNRYRMEWMRQMLKRENRTVDAIMVGNLGRSISFFANTTIFILLGLMTMLGYKEKLSGIFNDVPFIQPTTGAMWEVKIFLLIIIFVYSFFKYTWSLRQYNYAGIFIAACPPAYEKDQHDFDREAGRGAYIISSAARHFNNALRAYYFGLAALAWFIHPYLFMIATAWVIHVTRRREFRSGTLKALN